MANREQRPLHWSDLSRMSRSPAHVLASLQAELEDTYSMRIGRLVHQIVLGGPPSAVWDGTRRGKEWDAFKASNAGREIVTISEVTAATAIASAVQGSEVAAPFLDGDTEVSLEWTWLGRKCATRGVDVLGDGFISDLKTTRCAEPRRFASSARWMGLHAQLAFYREGVRAAKGRDIEHAYLIAVENSAPHCVTVLHVGPDALDEGERMNRLWMERFLACEEAGEWPGYVQSVQEFTLGDVEDAPSLIVGGEAFDWGGVAA